MEKISFGFHLSFLHLKPDFRYSSLSFVKLSWGRITNKLAISEWQNVARVRLQHKVCFQKTAVNVHNCTIAHMCVKMWTAALTQSIKNELAWRRIEPKNSAAFHCFFPAFRPRRRSENSLKNVAFKHRIRSICLYRHCNALHFSNKRQG